MWQGVSRPFSSRHQCSSGGRTDNNSNERTRAAGMDYPGQQRTGLPEGTYGRSKPQGIPRNLRTRPVVLLAFLMVDSHLKRTASSAVCRRTLEQLWSSFVYLSSATNNAFLVCMPCWHYYLSIFDFTLIKHPLKARMILLKSFVRPVYLQVTDWHKCQLR